MPTISSLLAAVSLALVGAGLGLTLAALIVKYSIGTVPVLLYGIAAVIVVVGLIFNIIANIIHCINGNEEE